MRLLAIQWFITVLQRRSSSKDVPLKRECLLFTCAIYTQHSIFLLLIKTEKEETSFFDLN